MTMRFYCVAVICFSMIFFCACSLNRAVTVENTVELTAPSEVPRSMNTMNHSNGISVKLIISEVDSSDAPNFPIFLLVIENNASEPVDVGALNLLLTPLVDENRTDTRNQINSPVDIVYMTNLERNQSSELLSVPAGDKVKRELRIESLRWLRSIQSFWEYKNLKDFVKVTGRYQMHAELDIYPRPKAGAKELTIGNQDIRIVPNYRVASNQLEITWID